MSNQEKLVDPKQQLQTRRYQLSSNRFIYVCEYKNKPMINIREFYVVDSETRPKKKGISLSKEQWKLVKDFSRDIDVDIENFEKKS